MGGGGGGGKHFGLLFISCTPVPLGGSGGMPPRIFCALRQLLVQSEAKHLLNSCFIEIDEPSYSSYID